MFNFISKTFLLCYGRRCTITSTNCNKDFAFPLFIKCLSSATSNQHSFTVSLKSALSASKHNNFNTPEKPDSVLTFFKSHGFSETQILKVIRARPQVLGASPERIVLPKLEFFYSKGFSRPELAKISSVCPGILCRSLENHIIPAFNCLIDLFKSSEKVVYAVKHAPDILNLDVETQVAPGINVLRDIGVPERNIILFLNIRCRRSKLCLASFKNTVEVVKEMGVNPLKSQFILAVIAKGNGKINWESKVEIYRRWGWSEEEFLSAFRNNPLCMLASKDKIMTVMDFLLNKMNLESSAIAKRSDVIKMSMKKRIIPRAAVFQFLLSKGLIKSENTNLITFIRLPEKAFLQKYVISFDEAPEILKLYQENKTWERNTT